MNDPERELGAAVTVPEVAEEERKPPGYRFPVVNEATVEFTLQLPPFPDAPDGFAGSLEQLLEGLRTGAWPLEHVPLAPVVDQYLAFREQLEPEEAQERISDFLPLAATLIHLKSQLFVQRVLVPDTDAPAIRQGIVDEIWCEERRRCEPQRIAEEKLALSVEPSPLTLLDFVVLLNEVRNLLQAPLTVSAETWSVQDAMRWIYDSLPPDAALQAETYFEQCRSVRDQATLFLAILELGRRRALDCHQAEPFAPLWLGPLSAGETTGLGDRRPVPFP